MSEKNRNRIWRKLEDLGPDSGPVDFVYRNGRREVYFVEGVTTEPQPSIYYSTSPPSPDVEYGSKVDPRDWLPSVVCRTLGYLRVQKTGKKISLMPFQ